MRVYCRSSWRTLRSFTSLLAQLRIRISSELFTWLDIWVASDTLLKRAQVLGNRREHPSAIKTLLDQIPLLDRIVDQVEDQWPLWFDDGAAGAVAIAKHHLHRFPFHRHHSGIGAVIDDMISSGRLAVSEEER